MVLIWLDMLYVSKLVLSSGALNHVIDCPKSHNLLMCLNIWSATCRKNNMKTTWIGILLNSKGLSENSPYRNSVLIIGMIMCIIVVSVIIINIATSNNNL